MTLYHYKTLDSRGKRRSYIIEAESLEQAKEKLRTQGILFLSLGTKTNKTFSLFSSHDLSRAHLVVFTLQLAELLGAGIPLYEALLSLEEQSRQERYHKVILSLCDSIKGGLALSEAMSHFPKSFSPLYCSLIEAGESVGTLSITLKKLSDLLQSQAKLRKKVLSALLYPAVLGGFSFVIVLALLLFVIPSVETLFEGRSVGKLTAFVIGLSHLFRHHSLIFFPALAAAIGGCIAVFRKSSTQKFISRYLLKTPLIKTAIIQSALARFTRTFATLLDGGVNMIEAMTSATTVMNNPTLATAVKAAEGKIIEGSRLSKELALSPFIPPLMIRMIAVGEESGKLAPMMHKIADLYESNVDKTLSKVTELMQPAILVIMGVIVGLIMMAVLLPLTDVSAFL